MPKNEYIYMKSGDKEKATYSDSDKIFGYLKWNSFLK